MNLTPDLDAKIQAFSHDLKDRGPSISSSVECTLIGKIVLWISILVSGIAMVEDGIHDIKIPIISGFIFTLSVVWLVFLTTSLKGRDGWYSVLKHAKFHKENDFAIGMDDFTVYVATVEVRIGVYQLIIFDKDDVICTDISCYNQDKIARRIREILLVAPEGKVTAAKAVLHRNRIGDPDEK